MARRPRQQPPSTKAIDKALRDQTRAFERQTKADLKEFRHKFSILRSKGLIRKSLFVKDIRPTKYRKRQLKDLAGIFTGEVAAVKATRKQRREFKEQGAKIVNGRILVNKHPEDVARVRKGIFTESVITLRRRLGPDHVAERIILPVRYKGLLAFLEGIIENPDQFDKLKNETDMFAFMIGGRNTTEDAFTSMSEMAAFIERYSRVFEYAEENPEVDASEFLSLHRVYRGVRLEPSDATGAALEFGFSPEAKEAVAARAARKSQISSALSLDRTPRMKKPRDVYDREYRANVKANRPERHERIKEMARARKAKNQPAKNPFRFNPQ